MKPLWRGTRVCGPCVVTRNNQRIAVAAVYGRGRDQDTLEFCVRPIMAHSFDFRAPVSLVTEMIERRPATVETSIGSVEVRPLSSSDSEWLPVIQGVHHTAQMLGEVIRRIDVIESSDDEGFYEPRDFEPLEKVDLLLSSTTNHVFGACWAIDDPSSEMENTWFRARGSWQGQPPTTDPHWLQAGGPAAFDWESVDHDVELWPAHASAVALMMTRLDSGRPIGRLSARLAGFDQAGDFIMAGDLPRGEAKALADEWLESGGTPDDTLVMFGEGRAELPVDLVLEASLARDERAFRGQVAASEAVPGAAWQQMADLAIAATDRHLWHEEPCDNIHCKRMNFAIDLMTPVDGPLDPFGDRKDVVNGMRFVIDDLVRCAPAPRPFRGVLEAPVVYVRFAQDWRELLDSAADNFDNIHRQAIAEAYASLFPSCGSMRVEAELERAGLSVPEPEIDDL